LKLDFPCKATEQYVHITILSTSADLSSTWTVLTAPGQMILSQRAFLAALCALLALAQPAACLAPHPFRRWGAMPPRLREHLTASTPAFSTALSGAPTPAPVPEEQWVSQPLDHFDPTNSRTWKQRYFANDAWFAPSTTTNLVFLCMGGEGPALQPSVVQTGGPHCALMVEMAKRRGALVLALEHRFYGRSQPAADLTTVSPRLAHMATARHAIQRGSIPNV